MTFLIGLYLGFALAVYVITYIEASMLAPNLWSFPRALAISLAFPFYYLPAKIRQMRAMRTIQWLRVNSTYGKLGIPISHDCPGRPNCEDKRLH